MHKLSKPSLVFFGTGPTSLDALQALNQDFTIEAVITKPAVKTSSGNTRPTEIEGWATQQNLPVLTPASKAELSELIVEHSFASTAGVVLDYGRIIPQDVIDSFALGIVNSHFSLLPQHRGADPIRAAILEGDKTTGVTIMKIVAELDAGPILTWAEYELTDTITEPNLRTALSELNCALLPATLKLYLNGDIDPIEQDSEAATYTSKTRKEDGIIDPSKLPDQLVRQVHAYVNWPKSYFELNGSTIVIVDAKASAVEAPLGKLANSEGKLYFGCTAGSLEIITIQPAGKKLMDSQSFINGYKQLLH